MTALQREVDKATEAKVRELIGDDANVAGDVLSAAISILCEKCGPDVVAEGLYRVADNLVACK